MKNAVVYTSETDTETCHLQFLILSLFQRLLSNVNIFGQPPKMLITKNSLYITKNSLHVDDHTLKAKIYISIRGSYILLPIFPKR